MSRSKKITVLHTRVVTGTGGGPEKTIINSPRFMAETPYDLKIAYLHPPKDTGFIELKRRAKEAGTDLISIPDRGLRDVGVVRKLIRICRELDVKIWHGHDYKTNVLGILVNRFHRMKLITTMHGWVRHTKRTPLYYWIDKQSLKYHDHVISVSKDLYDECKTIKVRPSKCTLIENAIDIQAYRRSRTKSEAREELGLSEDRICIGGVGRLSPEKGFDGLIRSCSNLIERGIDIQLVIAGDGEERDNLLELISEQPEPDRFRMLGFVNDMKPFYEALDIFALSSLREGLPNVILEAMASNVPIISTRVAGVPNMIDNKVNGLLVDIGDEEGLASAMELLCRDGQTADRIAECAYEVVKTRFAFSNRMKAVERIYDELCDLN